MTKNTNYTKWLALSDDERQVIMRSWNPYEGDGMDILKEVFAHFQKQFGKPKGVVNTHCGLYHGGVLIIGVTIRKGSHVHLPNVFEGFPIIKMVK